MMHISIGLVLGLFLSPFVTVVLRKAPDRFAALLAATTLFAAFFLGYLFGLVRSHYSSSPIQVAIINVKHALWAAFVGFLVTTFAPLLIARVVEGEPTLSLWYISIIIGFLGGISLFWVFLGLDVRAYLDYRFDHMVTHSALWTDEGVFEKTFDLLRSLGQPNRRWIFGKFISRKLTEDFQPIGSLTLAINNFSVTEYSHLLSNLIAESREHIHMTCPLTPDDWLKAVFTECKQCRDNNRGDNQEEETTDRHGRKGQCILSCDSKIIRLGDEVFDSSRGYIKEMPPARTIHLVGVARHDCRLQRLGLIDNSAIPRHLRAVSLSGASRENKIRLISSSTTWDDNLNSICRKAFYSTHQLIGDMTLLEYQGDLNESCCQLYEEITGNPLKDGEYFDYNILDGILIGYTGFRREA